MNKDFIESTTSYLKEVEDALSDDINNVAMNLHLTKLSKLIETLMGHTYESQDQDAKVILATLELRARRCLEVIGSKLAVYG